MMLSATVQTGIQPYVTQADKAGYAIKELVEAGTVKKTPKKPRRAKQRLVHMSMRRIHAGSHNQGNCASSHGCRYHSRGRSVGCIWGKIHGG